MIVAAALVIVVVLVAVIVRVQPSAVASDRSEPLIEVILMSLNPTPPKSPPRIPKPWPPSLSGPGHAWGGSGTRGRSAPGAAGVVGAGVAPMAAATPTTTSSAEPATMPIRTARDWLPGRRSWGGLPPGP